MSLEWKEVMENIEHIYTLVYVAMLPSGMRIQIIELNNKWYGFVYSNTRHVYEKHEAFEQTEGHDSLIDCHDDILRKLHSLLEEDIVMLKQSIKEKI